MNYSVGDRVILRGDASGYSYGIPGVFVGKVATVTEVFGITGGLLLDFDCVPATPWPVGDWFALRSTVEMAP